VAFSPLLLATLTRMVRRADIDAARALGRDALRAVVLGTPVLALLAGSAGEIVRLVYGTAFDPAAHLAWPFLLAASGTAVVAVTSAVLTAAGHARAMGRAAWPILPTALLGYALVVPRSGAMGAALVTCAATLLGAGLSLLSAHLLWRVGPPMASCLRAVVVSVPAYLLATLWHAPGVWWFVKAASGIVAVALAYVLLGELTAPERHRLLQGVRRAVRASA
jgi:O-antigen/teichoic acid export membrane protein